VLVCRDIKLEPRPDMYRTLAQIWLVCIVVPGSTYQYEVVEAVVSSLARLYQACLLPAEIITDQSAHGSFVSAFETYGDDAAELPLINDLWLAIQHFATVFDDGVLAEFAEAHAEIWENLEMLKLEINAA